MPARELLAITRGRINIEIDPERGGRLAQITVGDVPLLVGREVDDDPMRWGAYPMVPWAGRIRDGRFRFEGVAHQLPRNFAEHAIHGVGFVSSWAVTEATTTQVRLALELPADDRWPFGGEVHQTFAVDEAGLTCAMSLVATSTAMPYSMGWHPWFRKPTRLDFHPTAMYRRDEQHIALDELVDVPPGPWDDCFVHPDPIRMCIDGIELELSADGDHWVVYDEPAHATCVEPQTAPPDAFNLRSDAVLPGGSASTRWRITVV